MRPPGTLAVVATPIGNLEDLTFRALRTLKAVDLIAAEDTRRTSRLLAHYEISKPLVSLHEHNEHREAPRLVEKLLAGDSVALVTDAGTPGISDPGASLVRLARERGVKVVPIPGPSAVTAALSVSGLKLVAFSFLGFPPSSGAARARWLDGISRESAACVFFEAPHRVVRTLGDMTAVIGKRPISVHRELTKINEEYILWPSIDDEATVAAMGEFVVVVGPKSDEPGEAVDAGAVDRAAAMIGLMTNAAGLPLADVLEAVERFGSLPRAQRPNALKRAMIAAKRQKSTE